MDLNYNISSSAAEVYILSSANSASLEVDPVKGGSGLIPYDQDKVNLIPYGKRYDKFGKVELEDNAVQIARYKGKTEEELDFCPFRFEDSNGNFIVFRAILSGITDQFTPEYSTERYVGRPDNVYVYQGTTREISFTVDIYPKAAEEWPVLGE